MIIKRLSLTNYKNIKAATLQFSDKLNCIVGGNGMGKTIGKMDRRRVSFWGSAVGRVKNSGVIKRSTARCRTILGYFLR